MLPVAALLAAIVSCHARSHRPLAVALLLASVLDRGGALLPPRLNLAAWICACLAQAWGARRALREPGHGGALAALGIAAAAWCLLAPVGPWWRGLPVAALAVAAGAEVSAVAARRARGLAPTAGSRAGAVLAGADVAGVLVALLLGPEALGPPATIGAAGVAAVEALYLAGLYGRRDEPHATLTRAAPAPGDDVRPPLMSEHEQGDQAG